MKKRSLTYFGFFLLSMLVGIQSFAQVNHPASGSGDITETLAPSGFVDYYDQGGPNGVYSPNSNNTTASQIFAPSDATTAKVVANFSAFQVENNWDGMQIYDGNSTAATQISSGANAGIWGMPAGSFTNNNSPGLVEATSADGSLTFTFWSDGSAQQAGWASCITEVGIGVSLTGCSFTTPADQLNLSVSAGVCEATLTTALPVSSCSNEPGAFFTYSVDGGTPIVLPQPFPPSVIVSGLSGGNHTIDWTLSVGNANCPIQVGAGTQNVTVLDLIPPVLVCPADQIIDLNPGLCCQTVSFDVTASDNCPFSVAQPGLTTLFAANNGQNGNMFRIEMLVLFQLRSLRLM